MQTEAQASTTSITPILHDAAVTQVNPLLVITTQGRYSARAESTMLAYRRHGNDFVVVATSNDQRFKPGWFLNIKEEPIVEIKVGDAKFFAKAITPTGRARLELLPLIEELAGNKCVAIPRDTSAVILSPLC